MKVGLIQQSNSSDILANKAKLMQNIRICAEKGHNEGQKQEKTLKRILQMVYSWFFRCGSFGSINFNNIKSWLQDSFVLR